MDDRDDRTRRNSALRFVLAAIVASVAGAAPACLPSVTFDGPSADSGADGASADGPSADGTQIDGGADGRGDAVSDSAVAADSEAEATAPAVPLSGSPAYVYGGTGACTVHAGTLDCWGDPGMNSWGELGIPGADAGGAAGFPNPTPVTITAFPASQIVQIVMGTYHSCALYGSAPYCWGFDQSGQIGSSSPGDGGATELAVDGLPARGLTMMATGNVTTCGITPAQDGGVDESNIFCWGSNGSGELGRPLTQSQQSTAVPVTGDVDGGPLGVIPDAIAIAGGYKHFCVVTSANKIYCWGSTSTYECGTDAGRVDCTGDETFTCTGQPNEVTLPASAAGEFPVGVAAGDSHSCAVTQLGNVYCWGSNFLNQLGSAAAPQTCPGEYDAGVPCSGEPVLMAVSHIQKIFAAGGTTCGLDDQRHAWCWGDNEFGVLATGAEYEQTAPNEIVDQTTSLAETFDDIAMGWYSACGRDGANVYCWGEGVLGTQPRDGGAPPNPYYPGLVQF